MKLRPYRIRGIQILARRGNSVKEIAEEVQCSEAAVQEHWPSDVDEPKAKKKGKVKPEPEPDPEPEAVEETQEDGE